MLDSLVIIPDLPECHECYEHQDRDRYDRRCQNHLQSFTGLYAYKLLQYLADHV